MINEPMFEVGKVYEQLDGTPVLIAGVVNHGTSHETVYSVTGGGAIIHRYNRRDFGRVTGSSHDPKTPDPRNLKPVKMDDPSSVSVDDLIKILQKTADKLHTDSYQARIDATTPEQVEAAYNRQLIAQGYHEALTDLITEYRVMQLAH